MRIVAILLLFVLFSSLVSAQCTDNDGDGFSPEGGACGDIDCNDNDADISPYWGSTPQGEGFGEWCQDNKDNDCDGATDCADPDCLNGANDGAYYCRTCMDWDLDGYWEDTSSCNVGDLGDCNNNNPFIFPGNSNTRCSCPSNVEDEVCGDGIDQDCDGEDSPCDCRDDDGDGQLLLDEEFCPSSAGGKDCDDTNQYIKDGNSNAYCDCDLNTLPPSEEICGDGIDQDCDGSDLECSCPDADNDGQNAANCGGQDCNDDNNLVFTGQIEQCSNGIDDDCDGDVDCDDTQCVSSCQACTDTCDTWNLSCGNYLICGEDVNCGTCGEGEACAEGSCQSSCIPIFDFEICGNDIDENCDGKLLDTCQCENYDQDNDGYYAYDQSLCPVSMEEEDCNDNDAAIHPGAAEICGNDIDEDCSGTAAGCDTCSDGTLDGECNALREVCLASANTLTFNCRQCGCPDGKFCQEGICKAYEEVIIPPSPDNLTITPPITKDPPSTIQPPSECGAIWECTDWGPCEKNIQRRVCKTTNGKDCDKPNSLKTCKFTVNTTAQNRSVDNPFRPPGVDPNEPKPTPEIPPKDNERSSIAANIPWTIIGIMALLLIGVGAFFLLRTATSKSQAPDSYTPGQVITRAPIEARAIDLRNQGLAIIAIKIRLINEGYELERIEEVMTKI